MNRVPIAASEQSVGGHVLRQYDLTTPGQHPFATEPYFYYHQTLEPNSLIEFQADSMNTVFVLHAGDQCCVESHHGEKRELKSNEVMQIEGLHAKVHSGNDKMEVFVAGVRKAPALDPVLTIVPEADVKHVAKPWGYEMWLNSEHPEYAFKKIFLRSGTRTSLQYHQFKRETNLIYRGEAQLHYKSSNVPNDEVQAADISKMALLAASVIDVFPLGLHRIEALSDVLLYEVSTPHLNDVIRVSDDTNRPDGRIAQEHAKA